MDKLKALLEAKRKTHVEDFGGQKYVRAKDVEEIRLKRLREEEATESARKEEAKRARTGADVKPLDRTESVKSKDGDDNLSREEVIRRLRLLGQPATFFGEGDADRVVRLRRAQEDYQVEDEHAGGQQANDLLGLQKEEKLRRRGVPGHTPTKKRDNTGQETAQLVDGSEAVEDEDPTAAAFRRAARVLREKREEEEMVPEDRIYKYLKRWCAEWEQDLERRPREVKDSQAGVQATVVYKQNMEYFRPLFRQLKHRRVVPEMVAGIAIMVQNIKDRNYLAAYDMYMRLAVGNAPWPIGVTSVGIHERSAREKISHVMNAAHIMNDEATRKYLQGLKRLLTFMQRAYPTDPSRCVDFDGFRSGGSDKQALLEAERKGENWQTLGLPAPPNVLESDGSVKVPPKWENILRQSEVFAKASKAAPKTPPRTPPKSPAPV